MSIQKPPWRPKDGPGPRGVPDCYYTSRVLNSTHRYVTFVKALRHDESKRAAGEAIALLLRRDTQTSEFCTRSDRRNCINAVSRKVDLCMESYEDDINSKRARLREQLTKEEEQITRMMVAQGQAGAESLAREKEATLERLRKKRSQERTLPRQSRCVSEEMAKQRAKDEQIAHLYQMKERQSLKMQELEADKMWHEVAMKQDEALGFREEMDAVERYHRDMACQENIDYQVNQKKVTSHANSLRLKEEAIRMKQKYKEDDDKAMKEEMALVSKCHAVGQQRKDAVMESEAILSARRQGDAIVQNTFDLLKDQSSEAIRQQIELRKKKEMEVSECNKKLAAMRLGLLQQHDQTEADSTAALAAQIFAVEREKKCAYERKKKAFREAMIRDGAELRRANVKVVQQQQKERDEKTLSDAEHEHLLRMDALQVEAEAAKRMKHHAQLLQQIADNKAANAAKSGDWYHIQPMGLILKGCDTTSPPQ